MRMEPLKLIVVLAVLVSGSALWSADEVADKRVKLYPIVKGGKWGFMDQKGKVVIEPKYDGAWDFSEGLACVGKGLLRGYIDSSDKLVIEHRFGWGSKFVSGFAAVYGHANGKPMGKGSDFWGDDIQMYRVTGRYMYVDRTGKVTQAGGRHNHGPPDFSEGRANFKNTSMGTDMKFVRHDADDLGPFSEGLAAARKGGRWGYVDQDMKWVIEPKFHFARPFHDGMAPVGEAETPPPDDKKKYMSWVNHMDHHRTVIKWGFTDKTGKVTIGERFQEAWIFSEELAPVCDEGKWGFIHKSGSITITPKYEYAWPFSEGKARVLVAGREEYIDGGSKKIKIPSKTGYINTDGKMVIKPRFDGGWEFNKGLARVMVGDKEGYIDHTGKYIWEPTE